MVRGETFTFKYYFFDRRKNWEFTLSQRKKFDKNLMKLVKDSRCKTGKYKFQFSLFEKNNSDKVLKLKLLR